MFSEARSAARAAGAKREEINAASLQGKADGSSALWKSMPACFLVTES